MKNGKASEEPNKSFLLSDCNISQTDKEKMSNSFKVCPLASGRQAGRAGNYSCRDMSETARTFVRCMWARTHARTKQYITGDCEKSLHPKEKVLSQDGL